MNSDPKRIKLEMSNKNFCEKIPNMQKLKHFKAYELVFWKDCLALPNGE